VLDSLQVSLGFLVGGLADPRFLRRLRFLGRDLVAGGGAPFGGAGTSVSAEVKRKGFAMEYVGSGGGPNMVRSRKAKRIHGTGTSGPGSPRRAW